MTCPICRWISAAGLLALLASIVVPIAVSAAGRTDPDQNVDWTPPTNTSNWVWQPPTGVPGPTPAPTPLPTCAAGTQTWTVGSFSCSGDLAGATAPETKTATDATKPNTGSADFTCHRVKGWLGPRSGATCGPTECSATTVRWQVGLNPKWCTGAAAKTDIGKTLVVNGTRETPARGSATGTFVCQADGQWKHDDPGTDVCPQDCTAPTGSETEVWKKTNPASGDTWFCGAVVPKTHGAGIQDWIVGDRASVSDAKARDPNMAQHWTGDPGYLQADEGIGSAEATCIADGAKATGNIEVDLAGASCGPADCPAGDVWYWSQTYPLPVKTSGGSWVTRDFKTFCSADKPQGDLDHGLTTRVTDSVANQDETYITWGGPVNAECDNSAIVVASPRCGHSSTCVAYGPPWCSDYAHEGTVKEPECVDSRGCTP